MKKKFIPLILSITMLLVIAIDIAIVPFVDYKQENEWNIIPILYSVSLWIGTLVGYISLFVFYAKQEKVRGVVGIVSFFKNKYAILFDVIFILSLILTIVLYVTRVENMLVCSVTLSLLFISLNLHSIFNGKVLNKLIKKRKEDSNE